jgi:nicotinate-nucleotide adenylyltransferase
MDVAVYGGSFNPPHVGHAMVAGWLTWTERAEQVWLLPAASHAFRKALAPWSQRVAMCEELARMLGPRVQVCGIESELPAPSYTWVTLSALRERHPEHRFRLVVGSDTLEQTHLWHRWVDIEREFSPLVVGRVGYAEVPGAPTFPGVSSTSIREALARGEAVDHLVPAAVLARVGDLYR